MDLYLEAALQQADPYAQQADELYTQLDGAPEGERSFLESLGESFTRGSKGVMADVAVYEALHNPETEDIVGTLLARKRLQEQATLDPVEGRYITGLAYKAANTAGQIMESAKRAAPSSVVGAIIVGAASFVASAIFPTVGEEAPATLAGVVTGAKFGAKWGGQGAAGVFMFKQGVGSMYADMVESGIDPKVASIAAHAGGLPYAAIELAQFKLMGAPAKRVLTGKMKELLKAKALKAIGIGVSTYAKTLGGEVLEEELQELVQIATKKGAEAYEEGGLTIDRKFLDESVKRMYDVGMGSLEAFALLPVPGASLEAGVAYYSNQQNSSIADAIAKVNSTTTVTPRDVTDPEVQFSLAMRERLAEAQEIGDDKEAEAYHNYVRRQNKRGESPLAFTDYSVKYRANKMFREQEQKRSEERKQRLGKEIGAIREESNFATYTKNFRRHLSGQTYTTLGISPLEGKLPLDSFNALREQIRTASDKIPNAEAFRLMQSLENVYTKGGKFEKSDWKIARKIWGPNTVNLMQALSKDIHGQVHPIVGINDFMRSVASSMDLSYTLRQNKFMIGKPKVFGKVLAAQAKVLKGGVRVANLINKNLITSEAGQVAYKSGVAYEEVNEGFELGSEAYPSKMANQLPGVRLTGAAFTTAGNVSRFTQFAEIYEANKGSLTPKQLSDIAHIINIMSGIGDTKMLGSWAPMLNSVFFAPRNFFANVQVWTELFNPKLSGIARRYLAFNMVKWFSINMGILASLSMVPGVNVERDPESTDFGKLVIGKTHIDFWGGQLPLARTLYRLVRGERKTAGGVIVDAPRFETITRFLQSKLGPVPSAVLDVLKGESFVGEKRNIRSADDMSAMLYEKITPFFIQDVIDAMRFQGLKGAVAAPLAFFGASAQSYAPSKSTEVAIMRNNLAREVAGTSWDELGPDSQKFIRAKFPEIGAMEQEARFEREQGNFMSKIEKGLKKSQKEMHEALPRDVRVELDNLKIGVSGVSKRIATNWYLNDQRYDEYKALVANLYKEMLPRVVRSPLWAKLNYAGRVEAIARVTEELKAAARQDIIAKANIADLERVNFRAVE